MYVVNVYNNVLKREFKKVFWCKERLKTFVNKVTYSNKLTLLSIEDNSMLYD